MKHNLGNTPKCMDCYWYREGGDSCRHDGWCVNPKALAVGTNGRKRACPPEKEAVKWMWNCDKWEDAENHLTHYEVLTRQPEPWKAPNEQAQVRMELESHAV